MKDMVVNLIVKADASRWLTTLGKSDNHLKTFAGNARRSLKSIKNAASSLQGKLATLGISVGAMMLIKQSAELDKRLIRIGQTADISRIRVMGLRHELFRMSKETGKSVEEISQGFDVAVQAGLKYNEAIKVTDAVNKAAAVTNAQSDVLTSSLTTAAAVFDFDLEKPGQALLLLDKMRVAGKLGRAEMENLASIFPRVGFGAKRAGMNFDQTLAFIEGLSLAESNPERLGTLSASWLRLFTNNTYMQKAQKATGVNFFDKGARRDALDVFADIKAKYDLLKTDAEKHSFISRFLEGADTETITASVAFLGGEFLDNARGFSKEIKDASGTLKRELPDALNNGVDQVGRLKAAMREAADSFIKPFDDGISMSIKKLLDAKKDGGLEMSGKEIAAAGFTALGIGYTGYKLAGPALKKFLGKLGNTGMGIAEGKAIEAATGVTPVFVTNWPGSMSNPLSPSNPDAMKKAEDIFKKKKPGFLNKILPWLPALGAPLASTGATAIASRYYLNAGGSIDNLGASLHGMPEMYSPIDIENIAKQIQVKNEINLHQDGNRIIAESKNSNATVRINLNRGSFFSH